MKKKISRNFATSEFCVFNRFFGKQHCWVLRLILKIILIKCFIKIEIRPALMIKYKSVLTNNMPIYFCALLCIGIYILSIIDPIFHILITFTEPFGFSLLQQPGF